MRPNMLLQCLRSRELLPARLTRATFIPGMCLKMAFYLALLAEGFIFSLATPPPTVVTGLFLELGDVLLFSVFLECGGRVEFEAASVHGAIRVGVLPFTDAGFF